MFTKWARGAAGIAAIIFMAIATVAGRAEELPVTSSQWHGFVRLDFVVANRPALLVCPKTPAPGKPWIWRTEFFGDDHFPQADLAMLERGWYLAYMNASDMYGAPKALKLFDVYYDRVTSTYGLSRKVALEGFSRGGLYAFNYAALHPERVASIYLDAPALDIRSWPGMKHPLWQQCVDAYGLTKEEAKTAKVSPIDHVDAVAKARIPIFAVAGDADEAVPFKDNIGKLVPMYRAAGGSIELIVKPGGKHHPHSLPDPTPIVEFLLKNNRS